MSGRYFLLCGLMALLLISCESNDLYNPPVTPAVWGVMSAVKQQRTKITLNDTTTTASDQAYGIVYADPNNTSVYMNAGAITINSFALSKDPLNQYSLDLPDLHMDSTATWFIDGNGAFNPVSYDNTDTFPSYTGNIPFEINKANGLTLTFDEFTLFDADSVRVYIEDGANLHTVLKEFSAHAGTVTISPADLSVLSNVSDFSASIGIMPYKGTLKVFQNRGFFFVKETRIFQSVNIQ